MTQNLIEPEALLQRGRLYRGGSRILCVECADGAELYAGMTLGLEDVLEIPEDELLAQPVTCTCGYRPAVATDGVLGAEVLA